MLPSILLSFDSFHINQLLHTSYSPRFCSDEINIKPWAGLPFKSLFRGKIRRCAVQLVVRDDNRSANVVTTSGASLPGNAGHGASPATETVESGSRQQSVPAIMSVHHPGWAPVSKTVDLLLCRFFYSEISLNSRCS